MKKFQIIVFISGNGSNLQSLIDKTKESKCPYEINCVVSNNPEAHGLKRASINNISSVVLDHNSFKSRSEFDSALEKEIEKMSFDLIVLAGFMRIINKNLIKKYEKKIINLHPSILPKYPGLDTHSKVIENKDKFHGATVHFVDEGLDTGKIIGFSKFKTKEINSYDSLLAKTHEIEHKLLPKICSLIALGKVIFKNEEVFINGKFYKKGKEFIF
jgi:phosphoribosylglycinamide formyltransferase-1